jgi:hypothetical protein
MAEDEIDKILAADPNANVVEGDQQAWLLTGDQVKVARDALPKPEKPEKP